HQYPIEFVMFISPRKRSPKISGHGILFPWPLTARDAPFLNNRQSFFLCYPVCRDPHHLITCSRVNQVPVWSLIVNARRDGISRRLLYVSP
ncbi:MAG: hypothetical protein ACR2M3_11970, partial [Thermomicrobiales bacterium]